MGAWKTGTKTNMMVVLVINSVNQFRTRLGLK